MKEQTFFRTAQINVPDSMIDFGVGQPAPDLLPLELMQEAANHRLRQQNPDILNYGYAPGDGYFLMALADFLHKGYGIPVTAANLFATAGASQALDMVCTLFTRPGDTIFVEEPSYFLALRIFADHHLNIISIPINENGIILDALTEKLKTHRPRFLYTIPTFQNPTGVTMPLAHRERLVALSQKHSFLIVADEVYQLLYYQESAPPPPLATFNASETVISLGSFSKILAPGLRLGWIQAAPAIIKKFTSAGIVDSGGGLNHFVSTIICSAIELGLQSKHLAYLKRVYTQRVAAMDSALQAYWPTAVYHKPAGGFFFWLTLPTQINTSDKLVKCRRQDVGYQPGLKFSSQQGLKNCLRLSFAYYNDAAIQSGIKRLAAQF